MLSASQLEKYQRDGFVLGKHVLSDSAVDELREEIDRVIRDREREDVPQPVLCHNMGGRTNSILWQIVNIWQASEPFMHLALNPQVADAVSELMGDADPRLWHDQIQYKVAGQGGVNMWHQDTPYWPILTGGRQMTAWVALDDVDEGNGCMSMVPGTHRWGNTIEFLQAIKTFDAMPSEWKGRPVQVVTCPVRKGHVHFHHGLTWHGSHANTSNRPRRAIALHFMSADTCYNEAGVHPMKRFVTSLPGQPVEGQPFLRVHTAAAAAAAR